MIIDYRV